MKASARKQKVTTIPESQQLRFQCGPAAFQLSRKTLPDRTKMTRTAIPR